MPANDQEWLKEIREGLRWFVGWRQGQPDGEDRPLALVTDGRVGIGVAEWLSQCVAEIDRLTMEASRLIHAKEQERHARLDHQAEVGRLRGALKDLVEALEPHPVRHGRTLISEAWLKARVALGDAGKGEPCPASIDGTADNCTCGQHRTSGDAGKEGT